ncbi:hypothetical protein ACJX0J_038143, partial [Zea mays]
QNNFQNFTCPPASLNQSGTKLNVFAWTSSPELFYVDVSGALVPVKTEEPVPVATVSSPPRALPPPRLCRQFWKSGDYVVTHRNPDAVGP